MAKLKGPLLSMRASGSIGKTNVYSSWRGIPYARMHVVPQNPNTAGQTLTRTCFSWLNDVFRHLGVIALAPWESYATGRAFTARNGFIKQNLPVLRNEADITNYIGGPGSLGGPAIAALVTGAGAIAKDVTATITVGALPSGWALLALNAFAIIDQLPDGPLVPDMQEDNNAGPSGTIITMNMGQANQLYRVCGWATYTRPDGTVAFSPAETAAQASHA
jgi:hypothetical protein